MNDCDDVSAAELPVKRSNTRSLAIDDTSVASLHHDLDRPVIRHKIVHHVAEADESTKVQLFALFSQTLPLPPAVAARLLQLFRIATLGLPMARQKLGQHFLSAPGWQKRILNTLSAGADDTWIEIGPGHGEMTRLLAAKGRRVIAVEADPRLAESLQETVRAYPEDWPGVEVVAADILALDLGNLAARFRVFGNLPYYITSPILHHLFGYADQTDSIHVVMQLEVADRVVARPGRRTYGYLSAACQFYARPELALKIPPGAFRPPPKVRSGLVHMAMPGEGAALGIADARKFLEFVQLCFGHKRKTLRNNLRANASDSCIHEALKSSGLRPDTRAEQLSLAQFAALFAALDSKMI